MGNGDWQSRDSGRSATHVSFTARAATRQGEAWEKGIGKHGPGEVRDIARHPARHILDQEVMYDLAEVFSPPRVVPFAKLMQLNASVGRVAALAVLDAWLWTVPWLPDTRWPPSCRRPARCSRG